MNRINLTLKSNRLMFATVFFAKSHGKAYAYLKSRMDHVAEGNLEKIDNRGGGTHN